VHERGRLGEPLNPKQLRSAARGELQLGLSHANYDTWFKDTSIVSEEDDVYFVAVPNAFAREWLENKYRPQVRAALQHLLGRTVDVRFVTQPAPLAGMRPGAAVANGAQAGAPPQTRSPPERRDAQATALPNPRNTSPHFADASTTCLPPPAA